MSHPCEGCGRVAGAGHYFPNQRLAVPTSEAKGIKVFQERQIREAWDWVGAGGQALHLMSGRFAYLRDDTPACFRGRNQIAHLFDRDRDRLQRTARKLGVRKILVEREGDPVRQHIDLCGKPLDRALAMAAEEAAKELAAFTNPEIGLAWDVVPDAISARVDAHERGMVIIGGQSMGKTAALKIILAKQVKEENA